MGMARQVFDAYVRPYLTEIPVGIQGKAFDRLELDAWADHHKDRYGRQPRQKYGDDKCENREERCRDSASGMALFKANTGCREREVCRLRWDWEVKVPELNTSVFIIPAHTTDDSDNDLQLVKNKEDRLVAPNSIARSIIDRGTARTRPMSSPTRPVRIATNCPSPR